MTARLALTLALALSLAPLGHAKDDQRTELLRLLREQLARYRAGDLDRREFMLRDLWAFGREQSLVVELCREHAAESELFSTIAFAGSDAFTAPTERESIEQLLARAADGTRLAQTDRYFRFLAAYDRLEADARAGLPDVPWVRAQRELAAAQEEALRDLLPRFDALGLPDVAPLERVVVLTTWTWFSGGYRFGKVGGWLLPGATPLRFDVLVGFEPTTFVSTGEPARALPREAAVRIGPLPRYDVVDYESELVPWIASGEAAPRYAFEGFDAIGLPNGRVAALFHARCAEQRGRHGLALRLVALARELFATERHREPGAVTLGQELGAELVRDRWQRAVVGLARGELRSSVAARLDLVVREFPTDGLADRARALRDALAAQLVEEEGHRPPTWAEWQSLSVEEKLRHLVFALRDVGSRGFVAGDRDMLIEFEQVFPPDAPRMTLRPRSGGWNSSGRSVADAFEELGWAAIPTLIELIGDPRPTRGLGTSFQVLAYGDPRPTRGLRTSFQVLTYGDWALQTLSRITGEGFYPRTPHEEPAKLKARVLRWWEKQVARLELDSLADGVVAADDEAPAKARRLLQLDFSRGVAALVDALPRATGPTRRALLDLITRTTGPERTELFRREVHEGPDLPCRLIAAEALQRLGDRSWVAPLVETLARDEEDASKDLLLLLLQRGGPTGEAAVHDAFARLPEAARRRWREELGDALPPEPPR